MILLFYTYMFHGIKVYSVTRLAEKIEQCVTPHPSMK